MRRDPSILFDRGGAPTVIERGRSSSAARVRICCGSVAFSLAVRCRAGSAVGGLAQPAAIGGQELGDGGVTKLICGVQRGAAVVVRGVDIGTKFERKLDRFERQRLSLGAFRLY